MIKERFSGTGKRTKEKTESARQNKPVGLPVVLNGLRVFKTIPSHPHLSLSPSLSLSLSQLPLSYFTLVFLVKV